MSYDDAKKQANIQNYSLIGVGAVIIVVCIVIYFLSKALVDSMDTVETVNKVAKFGGEAFDNTKVNIPNPLAKKKDGATEP